MKFLTREDINNILVDYQKEIALLFEKPMNYEGAAEYLFISVDHLRRLVMQNKVPYHKPEGRVYFFTSELNKYIKEQ